MIRVIPVFWLLLGLFQSFDYYKGYSSLLTIIRVIPVFWILLGLFQSFDYY